MRVLIKGVPYKRDGLRFSDLVSRGGALSRDSYCLISREGGKMKIEVTQVKSGIRFAMKRESGRVLLARFIPFNHKEKDRKVVFEMSVKEEKRKDVE